MFHLCRSISDVQARDHSQLSEDPSMTNVLSVAGLKGVTERCAKSKTLQVHNNIIYLVSLFINFNRNQNNHFTVSGFR